ncbi:MAG: hypothetical protein EBW14_15795 [Oxalobacteraceae bacterium]|nr:hypothetical protein [Oxalobacteraceae bacterium]
MWITLRYNGFMPIHIPIYINDKLIKTYHIGRVAGDTNPDSINKYLIVQDDQLWSVGREFEHRYGDGVEACIIKGINACG